MLWYTIATSMVVFSSAVTAFKGASPYLLFSTSRFPSSSPEQSLRQIQDSHDVLESTKDFLSACPSDTYIIISQPTLHADDLSSNSIPHLRRVMSNENMRTRIGISEVVGEVDPEHLRDYLVSNCQAGFISLDGSSSFDTTSGEVLRPLVVRADFQPLPSAVGDRAAQLAENDDQIRSILESRPSTNLTIIYTSTPVSDKTVVDLEYNPAFIEPLHMELKRSDDKPRNDTERDNRPLFEKYQFFTPGIFMGLLVVFILLSILSVGLSALGSLQVSYGAFDKEMGPAAQKK